MEGIIRVLPNNKFQAALNSNPAASALNPFSTIADTLYGGNGVIGAARVATITDTVTFDAGTTIMQMSSGGNSIRGGVGSNAGGFGTFGTLHSLINGGAGNNGFYGLYMNGGSAQFDAQLYDGSGENSGIFIGEHTLGGGVNRSAMYWNDGAVTFNGFEANPIGEQIYSQRFGLAATALAGTEGIAFYDGTGYLRAATLADLSNNLSINTLYAQNDTVGAGRIATLTDTLEFRGGLVRLSTTASSTPYSGTVSNLISSLTHTATTGVASWANSIEYNPSANATAFIRAQANRVNKLGANNAGTIIAVSGEGRNSGTGNITNLVGLDGFVWATGTGNITNHFGVRARPQVQGAATITNFGGLNVILGQQVAGATITNMYGVLINTPTNTGAAVSNTYGVRVNSNLEGSSFNYGFYQAGLSMDNAFEGNLRIGDNAAPQAKFHVTGTGNGSGRLINFEQDNGLDRYIANDNGQRGIAAGTANAVTNANFGHYHQSTGYSTGHAFYTGAGASTSMLIQHIGGGANPIALNVGFQGAPTVNATAIRGLSWQTSSARNTGVYGSARNGTIYSVGVFGETAGGASNTPSDKVAGVWGQANTNVDALSYGGYFTASYNNAALNYTQNMIGVQGLATVGTVGGAGSTGIAIGGRFRTVTAGGAASPSGNMALNVPSIGALNDGNVVIGADTPSANQSLVEIHGDLEIFGSANGLIQESPDASRWRTTVDNFGTLVTAAA